MSITYQQWCLPKQSMVLHHAIQDLQYCQCLEFVWLNQDDIDSQVDQRYMADMQLAKRRNSHTGTLFDFVKSWDVIKLCLTIDVGSQEAALNEKALNGALELNPAAKTVQGFGFKYIPHEMLNNMLLALDKLQYEQFVQAESSAAWHDAYGSRFYNSELCWEIFLAWKTFLRQAERNFCDIICVQS